MYIVAYDYCFLVFFFFFKQKTAYEMRISDWSSDVCSSDLSRKLKIGLLWHSGKSGNLGVGALTMANMAIARQIAEELGFEPAFTIIGVADKGGAYVQPEEAQIYEVNSRRLLDRKSTRLNSSH